MIIGNTACYLTLLGIRVANARERIVGLIAVHAAGAATGRITAGHADPGADIITRLACTKAKAELMPS